LRTDWQALQPLTVENEARLWKKLRLEWNFHSNHIEGNTLTYGETELLLLHDRTTGNHTHREYLEMKAHDAGIAFVRTLAADKDRVLSEADIRDLNKIILKEPFWKAAETQDGLPTRKEIVPGRYKTTPNNVRLPNGDIFYFASVEDTPPRMAAFGAWFRKELDAPTLHPAVFAARAHHEFVLIHPFDDGNGRVARLLVNYILMRCGYLPIIVRTEDKAHYLTALHLADAGELSALIAYFVRLSSWSLNLGIRAAKGERIDEPSDVEKEIAIFIRNEQPNTGQVKPRSVEAVREIVNLGLRTFLQKLTSKFQQLEPLFSATVMDVAPKFNGLPPEPTAVLEELAQRVNTEDAMVVHLGFRGYKGRAAHPFDWNFELRIHFDAFTYSISSQNRRIFQRLYSEPLLPGEAEKLAADLLAEGFATIKSLAGAKE
jgi:Fic family protein